MGKTQYDGLYGILEVWKNKTKKKYEFEKYPIALIIQNNIQINIIKYIHFWSHLFFYAIAIVIWINSRNIQTILKTVQNHIF